MLCHLLSGTLAQSLAQQFIENFRQFTTAAPEVVAAGPDCPALSNVPA
jgi:hypothetical protein